MRHTFALVLFVLSALVVGEAGHPTVALAAGSSIARVGTVTVGATPGAIAVDSATHRAYVANRSDHSVSVVDSNGPRVVETVPVGKNPEGMAVDTVNNRIYVANNGSDSVSVIDGETNQVVATITTGRYPSRVAVDPALHHLYVADSVGFAGELRVIDTGTHTVVGTTDLGHDAVTTALAVNSSTHRVFVGAVEGSNAPTVSMVDGTTFKTLAIAVVSGLAPPFDLAVDPDNHAVFVASSAGFAVLDGSTSTAFVKPRLVTVATPANPGSFPPPTSVAVDPTTRTVYLATVVADNGVVRTVVSALDESSLEIITSTVAATRAGVNRYPAVEARLAVDSSRHLISLVDVPSQRIVTLSGLTPLLSVPHDDRYFPQTGFRVDDDAIWDYFRHRGGVTTFGYPVSRTVTFMGLPTQFFQRAVVQTSGDGSVHLLNLLDPAGYPQAPCNGILPYASFNFAQFPPGDPSLIRQAPARTDPAYATKILAFVRQHAPNTWNGRPVNFFQTFLDTVPARDTFPNGASDPNLLPGFDLEIWGVPISAPAYDPHNHNFVYLRWQRGIMMYDATTSTTQALLIGDYFKALLIGRNLPPDLAAEAACNPFRGLYAPEKPRWISDPNRLPYTDLTNAFSPD